MMKKFSQLDFEMWGRQVVTTHLEDNIPMNDSIVKIAEENQLNNEQVKRIVEEANNQAYLQKFASNEDKYIEFPVADARVIAKTRNTPITKKASVSTEDYALSPKEHMHGFNTKGTATGVVEKLAGLEEPTDGEKNKMLFAAQGIQEQFEDKMNTLSTRFEEKVAELKLATKDNTSESAQALNIYINQEYKPNSPEVKLGRHILGEVTTEKIASLNTDRVINTNESFVFTGFVKVSKVINS